MEDHRSIRKPQGIASLVPEIYYDLIARITPGGAIILGFGWLGSANMGFDCSHISDIKDMPLPYSGGGVLIFIGLAYLVGILVTPISGPIVKIVGNVFQLKRILDVSQTDVFEEHIGIIHGIVRDFTKSTEKGRNGLENLFFIDINGSIQLADRFALSHFLHEYVKSRNPEAATLIPKMRAEMACCRNLASGSFLLTVCSVLLWIFRDSTLCPCLLFGAIALLAAMAAVYRRQAHDSRLVSFLYIIHCNKPENV